VIVCGGLAPDHGGDCRTSFAVTRGLEMIAGDELWPGLCFVEDKLFDEEGRNTEALKEVKTLKGIRKGVAVFDW